jgi:hypothetical protein
MDHRRKKVLKKKKGGAGDSLDQVQESVGML